MAQNLKVVPTDEELRMELHATFDVALLDFDEDGVTGFGLIELDPTTDAFGFDLVDDFLAGNTFDGPLPLTLAGTLVC